MKGNQSIQFYEKAVKSFREYQEMIDKIAKDAYGKTLEVGAGTGLLTRELSKNKDISELIAIEPSEKFISKFTENMPSIHIEKKGGMEYYAPNYFDTVSMSLVYHHVEDKNKQDFIDNLYTNLKTGGQILIGDVFLGEYNDERERDIKLMEFHSNRMKWIKDRQTYCLEKDSLLDGLKRDGEWKTSYSLLENQLKKSGFSNIKKRNFGKQHHGGYKIVSAIK